MAVTWGDRSLCYPGYGWAPAQGTGSSSQPAQARGLNLECRNPDTADTAQHTLQTVPASSSVDPVWSPSPHQSAPGPLTGHMGGVLSSIPLCSRAKELQDVPELDLRPEEKPESPVTVTQPQPVSQVNVNLIRLLPRVPREVVNQSQCLLRFFNCILVVLTFQSCCRLALTMRTIARNLWSQ